MTSEQVLGISQTLLETVEARDTVPPITQAAPVSEFAGDFADDEYVSGAQIKRVLAKLGSGGGDAMNLAASGNEAVVRQQHASDFTKYGNEINALIARVPAHLRTVDNLAQCVRMVRSNHIEEIARERAEQIASETGATFRSTGAGTPPPPVSREHSLEAEHIPAEWKARAAKNGITEATVRDWCRANEIAEKDFYAQFKLNPIVAELSQKGNPNG